MSHQKKIIALIFLCTCNYTLGMQTKTPEAQQGEVLKKISNACLITSFLSFAAAGICPFSDQCPENLAPAAFLVGSVSLMCATTSINLQHQLKKNR